MKLKRYTITVTNLGQVIKRVDINAHTALGAIEQVENIIARHYHNQVLCYNARAEKFYKVYHMPVLVRL